MFPVRINSSETRLQVKNSCHIGEAVIGGKKYMIIIPVGDGAFNLPGYSDRQKMRDQQKMLTN